MKFRLLSTVSALLLAGCAGYHIGPIQPTFMKGAKTIAVPSFTNDTLSPRIEVVLADSVIKSLQADGTYQVVSEKNSDVILQGTIKDIEHRPARSVRGNVLATKEFILRLRLNIEVIDRVTGEKLITQQVTGESTYFVGTDLQNEERQAVINAGENAATKIATLVCEGW